ncbi:MAG TPA: type II toxin-antitoxin system Phd/YefM family antitoxin [Candidatus Saccharimonadales bacterium]|jgi:prevent-host-death family protein|nr:type II toxin-antitoxin system Phd/YefM family antitoxin [Candidatus Saccharimonadales bacterium]
MSPVINVHDLKTNYSKYLDKVISGEEILLGKHGKAVAKIVPLSQTKKPRVPGALKGKIWISDDFDTPMIELWGMVGNKK